ncbi:MAG: hypothetical protein P1U86_05275 [Verrucomicrobiales bacterium]|nr:hypothetical protein [Verrucomicrobiales bacterium]
MKTVNPFPFLFAVGFLSGLPLSGEEGKAKLTTKTFTLPEPFAELGLDEGLTAQALLEKHGVVFPDGSSAQFLEAGNRLKVTNNEEELMILEAVVTLWDRIGYTKRDEEREKQREQIEQKLIETIIPRLKFEETPLSEIIVWLEEASVEFDLMTEDSLEKGIKISAEHLRDVQYNPVPDEGGFGFELNKSLSETKILDTPITIHFGNIPLLEALREIASLARLGFSVTENGVSFQPYHQFEISLETKVYPVPPEFRQHLKSLVDAQESSECFPEDPFRAKKDKKVSQNLTTHELLEWMGISFPVGSFIHLLEAKNRFVVKNSSDQIELIEALLGMVDAKASPEWQSQQKAMIESKLASIQFSDLSFTKASFYKVREKLEREILRLDTESKIWNRGITIELKEADSKLWSDQWDREISINLENNTAIEALEKLAAELDWKVMIQPRGVTFLTD